MAPPQRPKPKARPAVTFRTKPGRGEVKVSVLNIRGPFSADLMTPANPQTYTPAKTSVVVHRPQPSACCETTQGVGKPVSFGAVSKPQIPTTMIGSYFNKDSVPRRTGSSTQHLIGHSPGLRPLCLAGVSGSALKECLIIRSLHQQIQKKTQDIRAAQ